MYEENEDDWQVLKKFKQQKRNKLSNNVKKKKKLEKNFTEEKASLTVDLETLNKVDTHPLHVIENSKRYFEKSSKNDRLEDLNDDITKASKDIGESEALIEQLNADIIEIESKIKAIRTQQHAAVNAKKATGGNKTPVQECPKKCKISDITIACSHNRTMMVPPFEGGDIPTLHVVSGSTNANKDVVSVNFGGSCDHGKTQSADDSEDFTVTQRLVGNDQYCPKAKIEGVDIDVIVDRPSTVKFNPATNLDLGNTSPVYVLLKRLVFGNNDDTTEYDISFNSCKGSLPYKAKVIAHPKEVWDLNFSFGYKNVYEHKASKRDFARDRVKSYDAITSNGQWEAVLEGSYTYDSVKSTPVKLTLSLEELVKELRGKWGYLESLISFFEPINGFFENAIGYSEAAEEQYKKTRDKGEKRGKQIGEETTSGMKATFEGPTIKIGGSYSSGERKTLTTEVNGRKLTAPLYDVGGKGELTVAFDPLLKVAGEIDMLQYLLCTLGGPLGNFLRKVSNMSIGVKDEEGKLNKEKSYVETNLSLIIGLTGSAAGTLGFECIEDTGWGASEKTGIGGFIGFKLAGKASVDGQAKALGFQVIFCAGAEFKTTDESGAKESGLEVNYKPTMVGGKFNWAGEFIFNGLSIVWVVYTNAGVDGEEGEDDDDDESELVQVKRDEPKKEISNKVDIFTKRPLFNNDDMGVVNA